MPAAPKKKARRAPRTPRRKVWAHTFYLLQPLVQFVALVAVMIILSRCSPLAPSTDRGVVPSPGPSEENSAQAAAKAIEEEIQANMAEINTAGMEVVSESDMEKLAVNVATADTAMQELDVRGIFSLASQKKKNRKVMFLPLSPQNQEDLFRDGATRIVLSERLLKAHTPDKALKLLLRSLATSAADKEIGAAAYLVLPDATMQRSAGAFSAFHLTIRVSLSIPSDDRAYLEIQRLDDDLSTAQDNAMLLASALNENGQVAILLE